MPRSLRVALIGVSAAAALIGTVVAPQAAFASAHRGPVDLVDPLIGTRANAPDFGTGGGAGNTYPGATVPFGMVQWSPDTVLGDTTAAGGYGYDDSRIKGFSLTHLSGAGCWTYGDISFLPTTAAMTGSPAQLLRTSLKKQFQPAFDHAHESASAGSYRVALDPGTARQIGVRLSATTRTGAGAFTFPAGTDSSVLINAGASAAGVRFAQVHVDPARHEISGVASSGRFCFVGGFYKVYFVARFDRAFAKYGTWKGLGLRRGGTDAQQSVPLSASTDSIPGAPAIPGSPGLTAETGAYATFDTRKDRRVRVRVGLSFVSTGGARKNLAAEQPRFGLDRVQRTARQAWTRALDHARVHGGSVRHRTIFDTALYHAMVEPRTFSDADGRYIGMDGAIHRARGFTKYADFSGWDVYRTQLPLLALLMPKRASDVVRSLLADYDQSGQLPKWSYANQQTPVMTGDPAAQAIAAIWALGGRGFDPRRALKALVDTATRVQTNKSGYIERPGLAEYESLGYVPSELDNGGGLGLVLSPSEPWGPTATTLEYADADSAIARFAHRAGLSSAATRALGRRARDWHNVFDPSIKYVRPRSKSGKFAANYDPTATKTFVEGSGAQYTFGVLHAPSELVAALGGRQAARARLDSFFTELNAGPESAHAFLGNEPTLHTPYLYDWVGAPASAARVVRKAMNTLYDATPGGLPGNDDLGAMSSWWVLGALGFYPVTPGSSALAIGSPLFPRVDLRLGSHRVTIRAHGSPARFVAHLGIDGHARTKPWITAGQLRHAHSVSFRMSRTPTAWGTAAGAAPPS